jgi:signal transduction histidine kinase
MERSMPQSGGDTSAVRQRISRQLHDGPAQDIALAAIALDRLIVALETRRLSSADAHQARDHIDREALHNVRNHANADRVQLAIRRVNPTLEVVVIDGIGFTGASPDGHFGLEQIRELAEETGGRRNRHSRLDSNSQHDEYASATR